MLLLHDDDELPSVPDDAEATLTAQLGADGLRAIDEALRQHARVGWLKGARVIGDALKAGGFPISEDAYIDLHARRLITVVESGVLEAGVGGIEQASEDFSTYQGVKDYAPTIPFELEMCAMPLADAGQPTSTERETLITWASLCRAPDN